MTFSQETAESLRARMQWTFVSAAVVRWPRRKRNHGRRGARGFRPEVRRVLVLKGSTHANGEDEA